MSAFNRNKFTIGGGLLGAGTGGLIGHTGAEDSYGGVAYRKDGTKTKAFEDYQRGQRRGGMIGGAIVGGLLGRGIDGVRAERREADRIFQEWEDDLRKRKQEYEKTRADYQKYRSQNSGSPGGNTPPGSGGASGSSRSGRTADDIRKEWEERARRGVPPESRWEEQWREAQRQHEEWRNRYRGSSGSTGGSGGGSTGGGHRQWWQASSRTQRTPKDVWAAMGGSGDAPTTKAEFKKAYRDAAMKFHPDRNKEPDAAEKFRAATEAWEAAQKSDWFDKLASAYFARLAADLLR